jgi:hypothetical protein
MKMKHKIHYIKRGWNYIKVSHAKVIIFNLFFTQAEKGSATRIIMSISHQGLAKNISEKAFGKNVETISAAGAGVYQLLHSESKKN